jgi:hypothetical protein
MTDSAPYIGARIRLISKNDIRYEGTLHSIDSGRSTVILSEGKSWFPLRCVGINFLKTCSSFNKPLHRALIKK